MIWKAVPSPASESTQESEGFPASVLVESNSWSFGMNRDRAAIVVCAQMWWEAEREGEGENSSVASNFQA